MQCNKNRRTFLKAGALLGTSVMAASVIPLLQTHHQQKNNRNSKNKVCTFGSGKHSIQVSCGLRLGCMGMSCNRSFVPDITQNSY